MTRRLVLLATAGCLLAGLSAGCSDPDPPAGRTDEIPKLDQRARALPPEAACKPPAPAEGAAPGAAVPRCVMDFGRAVGALAVPPEGSPAVVSLIHSATGTWTLPAMEYAAAFEPLPAEQEARAVLASAQRDAAVFAVGPDLVGYRVSTGKVADRAPGPGGTIADLAWTGDGAWIVAAAGGKAFVLDAHGKLVRPLPVDGRARLVAVTPDGAHTAVANDAGAITVLGDASAPARTLVPSLQPVEGLAFAGERLWVASADGTLRAFDVARGDESAKIDVGAPLTRLALSADGRRAAVAGRDRTIRVYTLPDGKPLATLAWHQANVTALAWGAGPTLLSGDGDGKLAVWEMTAAP